MLAPPPPHSFGPVQRDVTGLVEPAMVVEELRPAAVVAHVEQAGSRAAEPFALAPERFGGVLLEPSRNLSAEFVLFRRVSKIHRLLRVIESARV